MDKISETIEATSIEDARFKAEELLGVDDTNLTVTPVGDNLFFASIKNLDAEIRFFIPEDGMRVQIQHVHEHLGEGTPLTAELIRATLEQTGVTIPIDDSLIASILDGVKAGESLENLIVVEGTPPIHGWDGVVELKVQIEICAGAEGDHDRVDFHERGFVETVSRGDELGRITFPTEGNPGKDVFGKPVAAKSGKAPVFEAGAFISVSDKGIIRAQKSGMVQYVHGVLSISELFEHAGDVDFHTGNIHMDQGSLLVKGMVHAGFEVSAFGNVIVGKTVREVSVRSGGDIELKQGVIESTLIARGSVYARFAQNVTITADGNVIVANNLHNCEVTAGDSVIVKTGKGIVRGGVIRCSEFFEAKEVGSDHEVDTVIEVGQRSDEENELYQERAAVMDAIVEINRFLGCEDGAPDMSDKNENEQQAILKVLATLKELQSRRTEISSILSAIKRERLERGKFRVIVSNMVYPGTRIEILGRIFLVKAPLARCMFSYSTEQDKVIVESI